MTVAPLQPVSDRRPRVLLIVTQFPHIGFVGHSGTTSYGRNAAAALRAAGADVEVLSYRDHRAATHREDEYHGVVVHRRSIAHRGRWWRLAPFIDGLRLLREVRALPNADQFIAIEGPNVDGQCWALALTSPVFWLRMHTPSWDPDSGSPADPGSLHGKVVRWLDGFTARRAAHRITHSTAHAAHMREVYRLGGKPIAVVPHGAPEPTQRGAIDRSVPRILGIAVMWHRKGMDLLVNAFATIADELPAARLDLVGEVHDPLIADALGRLERDAPLVRNRITVTGRMTDDALELLWRSATVVVVPSRYESFGLVAIEAMARGVPLVVSDAVALVEVAADAAEVFQNGSASDLAARLRALLASHARQAELSERGRRRFEERFTLAAMGRETLRAFTGASG